MPLKKDTLSVDPKKLETLFESLDIKVTRCERLVDEASFGNPIYQVSTSNQDLILKITNPKWKRVKTENEVASIDFIRKHTSIPVPKIYAHSTTRDSIGYEYILMERLPGESLAKVLKQSDTEQKKSYLSLVANIIGELKQFTYEKIGSFDKDMNVVADVDSGRGPFDNFKEYITAAIESRFDAIRTEFPEYISHFQRYLEAMPDIDLPFVFGHGDLEPKNFLAQNGRVTGLIDFEWAGAYPLGAEANSYVSDFKLESELGEYFLSELNANNVRTDIADEAELALALKSYSMQLVSYKDWFADEKEAERFIQRATQELDELFREIEHGLVFF